MAELRASDASRDTLGIDDMFEASPQAVRKLQTDELIVGLCAPIGAPVHKVAEELSRLLSERYGYECETVRLSRLIEEYGGKVTTMDRYERVKQLIEKGNDLRRKFGSSVLAELAISKIAKSREAAKVAGGERFEGRRKCFVVDSIKNNEELEMLRNVYRDMFHFVGVVAPPDHRQRALEGEGISLPKVYELIDRDSGEEIAHGQTVRDTFPQADFFVRAGAASDSDLVTRLERFLDLILRAKLVTPTPAETAMYQAASAAGNSACLSRQVGAAIVDSDGKVLSIGWNDVPRFGGGLYRYDPDRKPAPLADHRCFNWKGGKCFNDEEKDLLTGRVVDELVKAGFLASTDRANATDALRKSPIRALIEFSRSIHAEMHAILSAAENGGHRLRGAKLYCTTYPCHSCARHIVAAGISEVYYIEPYRKSQAIKLHDDAISEDEEAQQKVRLLPFDGVAPSRYLDVFRMGSSERKRSGKLVQPDPRTSRPVLRNTLESIPALEGLVVQGLIKRKLLEGEA